MERTFQAYLERESRSPRNLERMAEHIDRELRSDVLETSKNFREIKAYIERDLRRWEHRQPEYKRELGRILGGKLENIELTAINLFL